MVWDAKKILHQKGAQKWSQLSRIFSFLLSIACTIIATLWKYIFPFE